VQHHVNLLEKEQFLVSVQSGRRRRLFLAGTPAETRNGVDLLRNGRTWQLIQSVLERPGLVQKDITDGLAISRKVLRGYLDRLSQQGLVREVPRGRFRSYYPSDALFSLVQGMRGSAGPAEPGLDEAPKPGNLKPRDPLEQ
jgi:predicted transcriptional regulator